MIIKSKIITIPNSQEYIVVNGISDQFNSGPFDQNDTRHVSIKKHQLNSKESLDLTELCTVLFKSSEKLVKDLKKKAEGQLLHSQKKDISLPEFNRFTRNYKKYLVAATLAEMDRLQLPVSIELCGPNHLLVGFLESNSDETTDFSSIKIKGTLRQIDINKATISHEKTVKSKGVATDSRHHAEFIQCGYHGDVVLFNSLKKSMFGLGSGELLIAQRAPFSRESKEIKRSELFSGLRNEIIAAKNAWVVFSVDTTGCSLRVIEYQTFKILNNIKLAKNSESFDLSIDTNQAVIGHSNGMLSIVDIESGKIIKFRAHVGLTKDSWIKVKISQDGKWVASTINDESLSITQVESKTTSFLFNMAPQIYKEDEICGINVDSKIMPVYSFVDNILVVIDSNGLQELDPEIYLTNVKPIKVKKINLSSINQQSNLSDMLLQSQLDSKQSIIEQYHSPAIKLTTKPFKEKTFRKILGQSQFGGWPDLPKGSTWPMWQDRPMSFLAQINLAEMHQINPGLKLPKTGLLSFFLGCENDHYEKNGNLMYQVDLMLGIEKKDHGGWNVIYTEDISILSELRYSQSPLPELYKFCSIHATISGKHLPDSYSNTYEKLSLKGQEIDHYNKLLEKVNADEEIDENWDNLLMGYPFLIQNNPPEISCQLASIGQDPYQQATKKQLDDASKWIMLMQFTSDCNADFIWGDGGHFYFYGNREKIAKADFSETWVYFEN